MIFPTEGSCLAGDYTETSDLGPFNRGSVDGNHQPSAPPQAQFQLHHPNSSTLSLELSVGGTIEAFEQPEQATCPNWNFGDNPYAACNGQGYCIFTRKCVCVDDNACNEGVGHCRENGSCGCATNKQCGIGQICQPDGSCLCDPNQGGACADNQICLEPGVCSCTSNSDCGEGLICSEGVCSEFVSQGESFKTVYNPVDGDIVSVDLPLEVIDGKGLNLVAKVIDQSTSTQIGEVSTNFDLDRDFPLLNSTNSCVLDDTCPQGSYCQGSCANGLVCDPQRSRCTTLAEAELGPCRPENDFSQGIPDHYILIDEQDTQPSLEYLGTAINGCLTVQELKIKDACGNTQLIYLESRRAPLAGEVSTNLVAYRCVESCQPLIENQLPNGSQATRAVLIPTVSAPPGCYSHADATISPLDEFGQILTDAQGNPIKELLSSDDILQARPAYILSTRAIDNGFGGIIIVHGGVYQLEDGMTLRIEINEEFEEIHFNAEDFLDITEAFAINIIQVINDQSHLVTAYLQDTALVLMTRDYGQDATLALSGTAAEALGFSENFNTAYAQGSGDGRYRAQLEVYACADPIPVVTHSFDIEIEPIRAISLGDPLSVNQGEELYVSAIGTVSADFGG